MIVKVKKQGLLGSAKEEHKAKVDDYIFKEDLLNPEKEKLNIYFRGEEASGIVELNSEEIEAIVESVKSRKEVLKEIKLIDPTFEEFKLKKKKKKR